MSKLQEINFVLGASILFYLLLILVAQHFRDMFSNATVYFAFGLVLSIMPIIPGLVKKQKSYFLLGLLLSSFTPFNMAVYINMGIGFIFLFFLFKNDFKKQSYGKSFISEPIIVTIIVLLVYVNVVWLLKMGIDYNWFSIIGTLVILFFIPVFFVSISFMKWSIEEILWFLRYGLIVFLIEMLLTLLYPTVTHQWFTFAGIWNGFAKPIDYIITIPQFSYSIPDINKGTFSDSHLLAIAMIIFSVGTLIYGILIRSKLWYGLSFISFCIFLMAENSHSFVGIGIGVTVLGILLRFKKKVNSKYSFSLMSAGLITIAFILVFGFVYNVYFENPHFSTTKKGLMYRTFIKNINSDHISFVFGVGGGRFASQTANLQLHNTYGLLLSELLEIPLIKNITSDKFLPQYNMLLDATNEGRGGGTFESPRSGLIALLGEFGIIGCSFIIIIIFLILERLIRIFILSNLHIKRTFAALSIFSIFLYIGLLIFSTYNFVLFMISLLIFITIKTVKEPIYGNYREIQSMVSRGSYD